MLNSKEYNKLSKIVEAANQFLEQEGCSDFSVMGVNWHEASQQWVVSYCSDYSNNEFTNVWVDKKDINYFVTQHSFEEPSIEL
jgi:hypothetical protein